MTPRQRKSKATNAARSRLRMEQLRQHSAAGHTKVEAAGAIGMTVAGVDSLLYRVEGSTAWPISEV
jgi:hypothetical protein